MTFLTTLLNFPPYVISKRHRSLHLFCLYVSQYDTHNLTCTGITNKYVGHFVNAFIM